MKLRHILFTGLCAMTVLALLTPGPFAQSRGGPQRGEEDPLEQPLPPGIKVRAFIHRPRVVEPSHLGTCDPITTDSLTYGLAGWHLSSAGITWKLNESTVPSSVGVANALDVIAKAFLTWTYADPDKKFFYGGNTGAKGARFDGVNAILWKNTGAGTIAVTYIWYYTATGQVAEVDTIFNKLYPWAVFPATGGECQTSPDAYDLQNIAVHEFGHWIGLDDLYNNADADLTMYGFGAGGELKKRTLGTGDFKGVNCVAPGGDPSYC